MKKIAALLLAGLLAACGSDDPELTAEKKADNKAVKKEQHVLSNEQEILEASRGIQDLMDKDAEKKKKAMEEAMN